MDKHMLASRKRAIRAACKELGIDDDTRRAIMREHAGVESSTKLDLDGANKVLDHLRACGATKKHGKRPHNYDRLPEYITKVEALLADMGLSWEYADTIARNITGGKGVPGKAPGVERLAWVKGEKHWRAIIAALSKEQEKRTRHHTILGLLAKLGKDPDFVTELLRESKIDPRNWHRRSELMAGVIQVLTAMVEQQQTGTESCQA